MAIFVDCRAVRQCLTQQIDVLEAVAQLALQDLQLGAVLGFGCGTGRAA